VIAVRDLEEDALVSAVMHVVGQSRAFIHQVEGWQHEIGTLNDERAAQVVEALHMTVREPAAVGTLRHLERTATELLRALRKEAGG
jgi:hypothetical protein